MFFLKEGPNFWQVFWILFFSCFCLFHHSSNPPVTDSVVVLVLASCSSLFSRCLARSVLVSTSHSFSHLSTEVLPASPGNCLCPVWLWTKAVWSKAKTCVKCIYLKSAAYKSMNVKTTQTSRPVRSTYLTLPPPTIPASSSPIHHGLAGRGHYRVVCFLLPSLP